MQGSASSIAHFKLKIFILKLTAPSKPDPLNPFTNIGKRIEQIKWIMFLAVTECCF